VKEKALTALPAKDLYLSSLFLGRRDYVEHSCNEWWILSALHGVVGPDDVLEPYDLALNDFSRAEKREWSAKVLQAIDLRVSPRRGETFEMHAGADYRLFGVEDGLQNRGCLIVNPTEGLRFGNQLAFYAEPRWT
jgi:hypothetical protein